MTEAPYRYQDRYRARRLILYAILWLALFILSVKVSAGWATRSLSLLAESLHTLLTGFSSFLSLIAVSAPDRLPSRAVYGHGKLETAITLLLGAILGFACLSLLGMSVQQLNAVTGSGVLFFSAQVSLPLIQLLGLVVATSLGVALLGIYEARLQGSRLLRFTANQLLKDVWLTILVLAGLLGVWSGRVWLDPLLAILLVVLTARSFWRVLNRQLPLLVQQTAIAPEVIAQIVRQVEGVTHCYKIRSRGIVGRLVLVQMNLIVHPDFLEFAPLIAKQIEAAIREYYGPVRATIYIDDDLPEPDDRSSSLQIWEVGSSRSR